MTQLCHIFCHLLEKGFDGLQIEYCIRTLPNYWNVSGWETLALRSFSVHWHWTSQNSLYCSKYSPWGVCSSLVCKFWCTSQYYPWKIWSLLIMASNIIPVTRNIYFCSTMKMYRRMYEHGKFRSLGVYFFCMILWYHSDLVSHGVRGDRLLPDEGWCGEWLLLVGEHLWGETQDAHVVPGRDLGRPEKKEWWVPWRTRVRS